MSWQSKVLGLCKKYGSAAKFAATTILGAVVPGSPAVISLVEMAFDAAQKSGQDDWEINVANQLQTTADNQARLEQMLDVLGGDLQHVFAQMASLQQMPQLAEQMLAVAQANDARWHESAKKLDGIAHRFDRLEKQGADILTVVEETRTLIRGMSSGSTAATQDPVPDLMSLREAGEMLILRKGEAEYLPHIIGRRAHEITWVQISKHSHGVTNGSFAHLARLPGLQTLEIMGPPGITDEALVHIGRCKSLVELTIGKCGITGSGFEHLLGLHNLQKLRLGFAENLLPRNLATLVGLENLRRLEVPLPARGSCNPLFDAATYARVQSMFPHCEGL